MRSIFFAPRFWDTNGETALPMDTKISEKTFSTRIVCRIPASACVAEGIYHCLHDHHTDRHCGLLQNRWYRMRSMEYSSCRSNLLRSSCIAASETERSKNRQNTAEIPCAIKSQGLHQNTPRPRPATIQRSIKIFRIDENISSPNGNFGFTDGSEHGGKNVVHE